MSFAADTAAIFRGPLAVDAIYTPDGGEPVAVRVIPRQPDEIRSFGAAQIQTETNVFLVSVAAVANPAEGDVLTVAGTDYTVQGTPVRDERRLRWTLEAVA